MMPDELGQAAIRRFPARQAAGQVASNSAPGWHRWQTGPNGSRRCQLSGQRGRDGHRLIGEQGRDGWSIRSASVGPLAWWMVIYGG